MKLKLLLVAVLVLLVGGATIPLWGSCDLKYDFCSAVCSVRHPQSDIERASCRTSCGAEKAGCLAGRGAKGVGDFLDGLKH